MEGDSSSQYEASKSAWFEAAKVYIKNTQEDSFTLGNETISSDELESLLKHFPGSKFKDVDISSSCLQNKMDTLTHVLLNSEIQKLNVSDCDLTKEDLFKLMEVLKDSKLTELDIESNDFDLFTVDERDRFISLFEASHLRVLTLDFEDFCVAGLAPLFDAFKETKIAKLNFDQNYKCLSPLLSHLPYYSLSELGLKGYTLRNRVLLNLSLAIRNSTLKKLDLSQNNLTDKGVDILVKGLIHSTITELDLSSNNICGRNTLGLHLKDTFINVLNLNDNFSNKLFPNFINGLKTSKVVKLSMHNFVLQLPAFSNFSNILKDTNLERIYFSGFYFSDEVLLALGEGLEDSKLQHIDLYSCLMDPNGGTLTSFLSKLECSSVTSLSLCENGLNEAGVKALALQLKNSKLTHLELSSNPIGNGVVALAEYLKFSKLSELDLSSCKITDEGMEAFAKHLKESSLVRLRLDSNEITDNGAKTLALSLRDSSLLYLYLNCFQFTADGVKALAKGAEDTFITLLSMLCGDFYLEPVLWRNKLSAQRLINTFKCIAPEEGDNCFRFTSYSNNVGAEVFLENCLELYRDFIRKPSAISVLSEDKSITLCKQEINTLMSDEFPKQFSLFIAEGVDTDVTEHVGLLKKAEDWGLSKVVELLLLNRPLYMIDRDEGVLDPYVYKLLDKYNYTICNLDIEPQGRQKLIKYFTEYSDMEGASDVIRLLCKRKM